MFLCIYISLCILPVWRGSWNRIGCRSGHVCFCWSGRRRFSLDQAKYSTVMYHASYTGFIYHTNIKTCRRIVSDFVLLKSYAMVTLSNCQERLWTHSEHMDIWIAHAQKFASVEEDALLALPRWTGSWVGSNPYEDRCPSFRSLASNHSCCSSGSISCTSSRGIWSPDWTACANIYNCDQEHFIYCNDKNIFDYMICNYIYIK